jgi:hypothetical protein
MRIRFPIGVVLLCVALAACADGCRRSQDGSLSDPALDPKRGDANGYYEQRYEGSIYVLGSIQSLDKLRNGKPPKATGGGFSSQGQSVLFETEGGAGVTERLIAEYEKRHGLSQ